MAKAKRTNHRSGDEMVAGEPGGAVDNGVRGEDGAMLTGYRVAAVGNGRTPTGRTPTGKAPAGQAPNGQASNGTASNGTASNGTASNGQIPNGQGFNGPGPNAQGPNARGPNAPGPNAQGPNAPGPNAPGPKGQGQDGQEQNGSDGRSVTVAQNGDARTAGFGTPVRVDEIAVAAMALSEDLLAATKGLPESTASRQFRRDQDEAADTFRTVANELETTAGNLVRLAATEGQTCGVTWGICADHGLTLMNVGEEVVTCHVLGCHREQEAVVERCTQPVAYRVVDVAGPALMTCAGHAIACRLHLDGAVITLASDSLELL